MSPFHPVLCLPEDAVVLDLSGPVLPSPGTPWAIGRYDEHRPAMYTADLFGGLRDVHMGIDLGGPVGTPVYAFSPGVVVHVGYNDASGDYGWTLVTAHLLWGRRVYALYGHLSARVGGLRAPGEGFARGAVLGDLGDVHENGGWPPHVHFQLCWERPEDADMPGVVGMADRDAARARYPDPRCVLGAIYDDMA